MPFTRHGSWHIRLAVSAAALMVMLPGFMVRASQAWPATSPFYPPGPLQQPSSPHPINYESPSSPSPAAPAPPSHILIRNETDLAQKITSLCSSAAGVSNITTIMVLPATLLLTKALPPVVGPLQFVTAAATGAVISCLTSNFTALTVQTPTFGMMGLTWTGCGTVVKLAAFQNGTDSTVTISNCIFRGNLIDPPAVSYIYNAYMHRTAYDMVSVRL